MKFQPGLKKSMRIRASFMARCHLILVDVIDIHALAELVHSQEIPLIIDSTLATPALCRPLIWSADIVIHSLSKTMGAGGLAIGCDALKENFAHYITSSCYREEILVQL